MNNKELVKAFCDESKGILVVLINNITALKENPADEKVIIDTYIKVHTIKGNASFLKYRRIQEINEICEDLTEKVKEGNLELSPKIINLLDQSFKTTLEMVENIEKNYLEPELNVSALIEDLKNVLN